MIRRAKAWLLDLWFIKPAPPMPEPWPREEDLEARILLVEERLRRAKLEIQFLRSQIGDRKGD